MFLSIAAGGYFPGSSEMIIDLTVNMRGGEVASSFVTFPSETASRQVSESASQQVSGVADGGFGSRFISRWTDDAGGTDSDVRYS
jgi:hypothetical protein